MASLVWHHNFFYPAVYFITNLSFTLCNFFFKKTKKKKHWCFVFIFLAGPDTFYPFCLFFICLNQKIRTKMLKGKQVELQGGGQIEKWRKNGFIAKRHYFLSLFQSFPQNAKQNIILPFCCSLCWRYNNAITFELTFIHWLTSEVWSHMSVHLYFFLIKNFQLRWTFCD